jgi:hypothetical protein
MIALLAEVPYWGQSLLRVLGGLRLFIQDDVIYAKSTRANGSRPVWFDATLR